MRVLIAGCGDVGTVLGLALAADGHEVHGLRRRVEGLPPPLRPVAADLTRPETLTALPAGIEAVVYTAAASGFDESAYRAAYVDGVRHLRGRLVGRGDPCRRFLFASSTAVYGQGDGNWVDEDAPAEPVHFSGRCLQEGEAEAGAGPWTAVAVRIGGIYGPGRNRLVERVRQGEPCVEVPAVYTNRIHRDDCAGVFRHLLYLADPAPVYLAVDSEPAAQCVVMDWLAVCLGVPPPPRRAAWPGESPQRGNKRCRNARLLASGYRFRYPTFREGYSAVLAAGRTP